MRNHKRLLLFLSLITTYLVNGQDIKFKYDSSGKLIEYDKGFGFAEGNKSIELSIDWPKAAHEKFLKTLSGQFLKTYETLETPENKLDSLYRNLWGSEYISLKEQIKELAEILKSENPYQAFSTNSNSFSAFLGRPILTELLFTRAFSARSPLTNSSFLNIYNDAINLKATISLTPYKDSRLQVQAADFYNLFIQQYFELTRAKTTHILDKKPSPFTPKTKNEINELFGDIKDNLSLLYCEPFAERYLAIENKITDPVKLSEWLKAWIWFNSGSIALNPLPFTDDEFLNLTVSEKVIKKSKEYDSLRESAIKILLASNDMKPERLDTKIYDSLLMQSGKGNSFFKDKIVESIKLNNKKYRDNFQAIYKTWQATELMSYPEDETKTTEFRIYNAEEKLKGDRVNFKETMRNDAKIYAVVTNIKKGQIIEVKNEPIEIADQSAAIAGLNTVGDALGGLAGLMSKTLNISGNFANLITATKKVSNQTVSFGTQSRGPASDTVNLATMSLQNKINSSIQEIRKDQALISKWLSDQRDSVADVYNNSTCILEDYDNSLKEEINKFSDESNQCYNQLLNSINSNSETLRIFDDFEDDFKKNKKQCQTNVKENWAAFQLAVSEWQNKIESTIRLRYINLIFWKELDFTLPPKEIKAETDTLPNYYTQIYPIGIKDKANNNPLTLSLIQKEGNQLLVRRTDAFKTAPRHWVLPSMGLGYVFVPFTQAEAKIANGSFEKREEENQLRLMAGLHFYPAPVIMADNRSMFSMKDWYRRLSIYAGTSFPKPLENIHLGISTDLWAGVKLVRGIHLYRYTAYKLQNGEITKQTPKFVWNWFFMSLQIEPLTFVKLFGILN